MMFYRIEYTKLYNLSLEKYSDEYFDYLLDKYSKESKICQYHKESIEYYLEKKQKISCSKCLNMYSICQKCINVIPICDICFTNESPCRECFDKNIKCQSCSDIAPRCKCQIEN